MILFIICLCLLVIAPIIQLVLSVLKMRNKVRISYLFINIFCLFTGLLLPLLATYIDIANLPPDVRCATPSVGFAFIGIGITIIFIPIITVIFYAIVYSRNKKISANIN
ncbi:hypothetical protein [Pedobacter rhodius]|uniref:Uncharacterized protein n=1 Tax=Pedobacter rhodius TaxID=3004098 RepID=A0ABT4KSG4_9SPHI|nr:hypothetical protein [Pedobacter sp. SJ11]MCZ4221872.1 hypothetical protein [Pedobacter sp. SJ11]